ncbi:hypothetical protein [Chamaesiphon sp.]|uniref:hypothetical protein n=1 Tax=Chamaesiphon sp. TaxID=2814140 RepID=UPI003594159C
MTQISTVRKLLIGCGAIATTVLGSLVQSASAAEQFNNQTVQFDGDTIIEFQFLGSNNAAQSTFGVLNLATGEKVPLISEARAQDRPGKNRVGTAGKAVRKPFAEYTFKSGTPYTLYLESTVKGKGTTTVYSVPDKNGGAQLAKFDNEATALGTQGVKIGWNDGVSGRGNDFNQFLVIAGGGIGCPCKPSPILTAPIPPEVPPTRNNAPSGRG